MQSTIVISFYHFLFQRRSISLLTLFFAFLCSTVNAQVNLSKVSLDAGIIKNQQYEIGNTRLFTFYPEVQLGGLLYKDYLEWGLNFGYWDDGVKEPFPYADWVTFSYHSYILGTKVMFLPQNAFKSFALPLHLTMGFSYHYVGEKYIGGTDLTGSHRPPHDYKVPAVDLGAGLNIKPFEFLRLRLDGNVYIPVSKNNQFPLGTGRSSLAASSSLTLGFDYFFN